MKNHTGRRIKDLRIKKRLTQALLCDKVGISKGFLSDVENGKRDISAKNLLKIAQVLKVSVDYLLTGGMKYASNKKDKNLIYVRKDDILSLRNRLDEMLGD